MVKQENVSNSKEVVAIAAAPITTVAPITAVAPVASCRQFWKAGDYEGGGNGANLYDGMLTFFLKIFLSCFVLWICI